MPNRFEVGVPGVLKIWESTGTWSATSGGATGQGSPTGAATNAVFDLHSGDCSINSAHTLGAVIFNSGSGSDYLGTLSGSGSLNLNGSLNLASVGWTNLWVGHLAFVSNTTVSLSADGGVHLDNFEVISSNGNGVVELGSNVTVNSLVTLTDGTLDLGGFTLTAGSFSARLDVSDNFLVLQNGTLSVAAGQVMARCLTIQNVAAIGGAIFVADHTCVDNGGNSGWHFIEKPVNNHLRMKTVGLPVAGLFP